MTGAVHLALLFSLAANALADELPAYQPRPVAVPIDAAYLASDGSVLIMGSEATGSLLKNFNELFVKMHPGFKLMLQAKGLPAVAAYGIITGISAFALIDREIWPLETRPFRQIHGYEPTGIHIGYAGYSAPGRANPPGIYVNARNPLRGLTVDQVARVFTTGGGNGDITVWGQLGLPGEWSQRVIHLYGPRDDGSWGSAIRQAKMGGSPFARRYEPQSSCAQIIHALADDPYGIALAGVCDIAPLSAALKMLPLAEKESQTFVGASLADVSAGAYPLAPYLMLYVNRAPGKPLDPFVKEYARMILSRDGQAIIAAQKDSTRGYLPLPAPEVANELNNLGP
jgi:phosphate transport system substrate-binding protein